MRKFLLTLGHAWASPVTAAGLLLAWTCGCFYAGYKNPSLEFVAPSEGILSWFFTRYRMAAFTWGAVIVYRTPEHLTHNTLRVHENRHTLQAMVLGVFMPLAYGVASGVAFARGLQPYRDNWFERDARRYAGQIV